MCSTALHHTTPWENEEWRYGSTILNLDTYSYDPATLPPRRNGPHCPMARKLGGPQSPSGRYGEKKNAVPTGNRTPACSLVARLTNWNMLF
jgi:hypothetical protein